MSTVAVEATGASFDRVLETVRRHVHTIVRDAGFELSDVKPSSSLIADLGLDSLKFVDLTVALEEAFGLREFPMQEWVDREAEKDTAAFTVASLVSACCEQLRAEAGGS